VRPKILFLHSELAMYFVACISELSEQAEVHVIHWPVNPEAPFQFNLSGKAKFYPKANYKDEELKTLCYSLKPDILVVSGWRDKDYVNIAKMKLCDIKVLTLDNPWQANLKQRVWTLVSKFKLLPYFSHAWVAGNRQRNYALKLGFKKDRILNDLYSADIDLFEKISLTRSSISERKKKFIYIGRYSNEKNIFGLFNAFQKFRELNKEWELLCLGTGPLYENAPQIEGITHQGFVQPADMEKFLLKTDVFILPSFFEPWGLVVHEMAAAGFPMILSNKVGASEKFLEKGKNGFLVNPDSEEEILNALNEMSQLTEKQYIKMSKYSIELSNKISPRKWADNLLEIL